MLRDGVDINQLPLKQNVFNRNILSSRRSLLIMIPTYCTCKMDSVCFAFEHC